MDDIAQLTARLERVERHFRRTLVVAALLGAALSVSALRPPAEVLRAKGLILTDARGRPRVVAGAALDSMLADARLERTTGIVVFDSLGRMAAALGTNPPLVLSGGRSGTRNHGGSNGVTVYDPRTGGERGGMSAFGNGQASNCLDYAADKEAVCMSVAPDDGHAAMMVNGNPRVKAFDQAGVFVGPDGGGVLKVFGGGANRGGIVLRAGKGAPQMAVYDSAMKLSGDALRGLATPGTAP